MEFQFQGLNTEMQHNQMYNLPSSSSSSTYNLFSDQTVQEGLRSGRSAGSDYGGLESLRGSMDTREVILRELEKERMRGEILAEEIARRRVVEADLRRKLMLEAELKKEIMTDLQMMTMQGGGGFPSSLMQGGGGMPLTEPSLEVKYDDVRHHSAIGSFDAVPFQRLPEEAKTNVVHLGKPSGTTSSKAKLKPSSPSPLLSLAAAVAGSSKDCLKKKTEWSCKVCKVNMKCELDVHNHLSGRKHQAEMEALRAHILLEKQATQQKTCKEQLQSAEIKKATSLQAEWRCEICEISASCEWNLKQHLAGKKHQAKMADLHITLRKLVTQQKTCKKQLQAAETTKAMSLEVEWRCAVCEIIAPNYRSLQQHFAGKKHKAKAAGAEPKASGN